MDMYDYYYHYCLSMNFSSNGTANYIPNTK